MDLEHHDGCTEGHRAYSNVLTIQGLIFYVIHVHAQHLHVAP